MVRSDPRACSKHVPFQGHVPRTTWICTSNWQVQVAHFCKIAAHFPEMRYSTLWPYSTARIGGLYNGEVTTQDPPHLRVSCNLNFRLAQIMNVHKSGKSPIFPLPPKARCVCLIQKASYTLSSLSQRLFNLPLSDCVCGIINITF